MLKPEWHASLSVPVQLASDIEPARVYSALAEGGYADMLLAEGFSLSMPDEPMNKIGAWSKNMAHVNLYAAGRNWESEAGTLGWFRQLGLVVAYKQGHRLAGQKIELISGSTKPEHAPYDVSRSIISRTQRGYDHWETHSHITRPNPTRESVVALVGIARRVFEARTI